MWNHGSCCSKGNTCSLYCYTSGRSHRSPRHRAEAILSFANKTTVVSQITAKLLDFAVHWTQTPSDYDVLVAKTMTAEWAQMHLPVLSQGGEHHLYTAYSHIEPEGKPVICHSSGCGVENRVWEMLRPGTCRIRCLECRSTAVAKRIAELDTKTVLGRREFLKVHYPLEPARLQWRYNEVQTHLDAPIPMPPNTAGVGLAPSNNYFVFPSPVSVDPSPPPPTPSTTPSPALGNPATGLKLRLPARPLKNPSGTSTTTSESGESPGISHEAPSKVYVMRQDIAPTRIQEPPRRLAFADIPPLRISTDPRRSTSSSDLRGRSAANSRGRSATNSRGRATTTSQGRTSSGSRKRPREEE